MLIKRIISPFLILLYLSAVIGFSFYNCHCEHSDRLVVLTYDHCECAHEHNHSHETPVQSPCNGSDCQHSSHLANENDCCSIVYKSIKVDQEGNSQKITSSYFIIAALPVIEDIADDTDVVTDYYKLYQTPPDELKTPLIYHNCQLRI